MATLLDLSHINLNLQQNVQPANLVSQPIQDYNALDKAGLKASQEFLQSFAKARAVTIDIQDDDEMVYVHNIAWGRKLTTEELNNLR